MQKTYKCEKKKCRERKERGNGENEPKTALVSVCWSIEKLSRVLGILLLYRRRKKMKGRNEWVRSILYQWMDAFITEISIWATRESTL